MPFPKTFLDYAAWAFLTIQKEQFISQWENFMRMNELARQAEQGGVSLELDGHPVRYLETDLHFPNYHLGHPLDFSKEKISRNFNNGNRR